MILIIDNYDSFTYNLAQYVNELGVETKVYRNDSITVQQIQTMSPSAIIISPGPGAPSMSKVSLDIIRNLYQDFPILGVCLGHQAIGAIFGNNIIHATYPIHGKTSVVYHDGKGLFHLLPNPLTVTRYHSLIIDSDKVSSDLEITAWTDKGDIMACQHKKYSKVQGIQFHPESLWTSHGRQILKNFLRDID
uniref:Anthranilate synthase component 2 n=1 Tax=Hommersandiophycus borowitzkae TaxID=268573 RepID=A0A1G4NU96_9FLOR|nr:Anthranilate synthase component II [Hommersandiophycus borowitzkae]SCW22069.1 Anthranilate synthase component II [Hommersandiophycus borowitzkae]